MSNVEQRLRDEAPTQLPALAHLLTEAADALHSLTEEVKDQENRFNTSASFLKAALDRSVSENASLLQDRDREKNSADLWAVEADKRADQRDAAEARLSHYKELEHVVRDDVVHDLERLAQFWGDAGYDDHKSDALKTSAALTAILATLTEPKS